LVFDWIWLKSDLADIAAEKDLGNVIPFNEKNKTKPPNSRNFFGSIEKVVCEFLS